MGKCLFMRKGEIHSAPSGGIKASDLAVGSSVYLNENGSPVEYLVVNQGIPSNSSLYDSSCDGTWLLRKNLHSSQNWNSSYINNYKSSTIHSYLNNTFFNTLDGIARSAIKQVKIPYVNGDGTGNVASGTSGLSAKVFLPGGYEIGWTASNHSKMPVDGACLSYFKGASNNTRIAYLNGTATQWWVRSPRTGVNNAVWYAGTNGSYDQYAEAPNVSKGIRPCVIIPVNAIFDTNTMVLKGVA